MRRRKCATGICCVASVCLLHTICSKETAVTRSRAPHPAGIDGKLPREMDASGEEEAEPAWVEAARGDCESDKQWLYRRQFLLRNAESGPSGTCRDRLLAYSMVWANHVFMGCRYPPKVMEKVLDMARGIKVVDAPTHTLRDDLVSKVKKRGISDSNEEHEEPCKKKMSTECRSAKTIPSAVKVKKGTVSGSPSEFMQKTKVTEADDSQLNPNSDMPSLNSGFEEKCLKTTARTSCPDDQNDEGCQKTDTAPTLPLLQSTVMTSPNNESGETALRLIESAAKALPNIERIATSLPLIEPPATGELSAPVVSVLPLIEPVSLALPLIEPAALALPLIEPSSTSLPLIEPGTMSLPLIEPEATSLSLIEPETTADPTEPVASALPLNEPAGLALPLIDTTATVVPLIETTAKAVPLMDTTAKAVPLMDTTAKAVPLMDTTAKAVPLMDTTAKAVPLIETTATAVPLFETTATPLPLIDTTATPLPLIDTTATPLPLIDTTATALPLIDTTSTALPLIKSAAGPLPSTQSSAEPLPRSESAAVPLPRSDSVVVPLPRSESTTVPVPRSNSTAVPLLLSGSASAPLPRSGSLAASLPRSESTTTALNLIQSVTRALPRNESTVPTLPPIESTSSYRPAQYSGSKLNTVAHEINHSSNIPHESSSKSTSQTMVSSVKLPRKLTAEDTKQKQTFFNKLYKSVAWKLVSVGGFSPSVNHVEILRAAIESLKSTLDVDFVPLKELADLPQNKTSQENIVCELRCKSVYLGTGCGKSKENAKAVAGREALKVFLKKKVVVTICKRKYCGQEIEDLVLLDEVSRPISLPPALRIPQDLL
ncbi:CDKN2A-interacting protein [Pleurodeles waltl]|uniref:CDKN2A-interacting protein n=1 Tax=Pleurodeles waltl TaxID=8319 RepID=UPI003709910F